MKSRKKNRLLSQLRVEQLECRLVPSTVTPPTAPGSPYAAWGSTNWSGISLDTTTTGAVTEVNGTWVVPAIPSSDTGQGYSSSWVGIDGDQSSTVEQIGTESDTAATAKSTRSPQYYAWYEMYPSPGYYLPTADTVQPGDQITATVQWAGETTTTITFGREKITETHDNYTLSMVDYRNGVKEWSFSTTQSLPNNEIGARDSAEWIEEAPSSNSGVLPLADFGSETFTSADATINGSNGTIGSFVNNSSIYNYGTSSTGWEGINLIDMGTFNSSAQWTSIEDETSVLGSTGDTFAVTYGSTAPAPPGGVGFYDLNERISSVNMIALADGGSAGETAAPMLAATIPATQSTPVPGNAGLVRDASLTSVQPTVLTSAPATHPHDAQVAMAPAAETALTSTDVIANGAAPAGTEYSQATVMAGPAVSNDAVTIQTMTWNGDSAGSLVGGELLTQTLEPLAYAFDGPFDNSAIGLSVLATILLGWNVPAASLQQPEQQRKRTPLVVSPHNPG